MFFFYIMQMINETFNVSLAVDGQNILPEPFSFLISLCLKKQLPGECCLIFSFVLDQYAVFV